MKRGSWTAAERALLRTRYADAPTKTIAAELQRSVATVYAMAHALGLKKSAAFLAGPASGRLPKGTRRPGSRAWTAADLDVVRAMYPDHRSEDVAARLGCSVFMVYSQAKRLGLEKSEAFRRSAASGRLTRGSQVGANARFQKGHVPWTKGRKGLDIGGKETRFKKGAMPHNHLPVGSEVVVTIGYWKRKIAEPNHWEFVHVLNWVARHGPVPKGSLLRFKDGDRLNPALENLECVTKRDHIAQHTIMNYPRPVREVIRLSARLRRTIDKRASDEKQD